MPPPLPDFGAADFDQGAPINNRYFPITPGTIRTFSGSKVDAQTGETETESNDVFATFETKKILGVDATVVRDTAYSDGVLVEDTLDWYAQDTNGNVWYLGEIAYNYRYDDDATYIGTDNAGSWTAGERGAKPGWIMPAKPEVGDSYYQEFAPGIAEDQASVEAVAEKVKIDFGNFKHVLKTLDTTALEPDVREFKYYAPGVGQVLAEEGVDAAGKPELTVELQGIRTVVQDDGRGNHDAGDTDEFTLSDLAEGKPLAGADQADGPEANDFAGEGAKLYVTLLGGTTELDDALGAYSFDLDTGRIGQGRILYASGEDVEAGDAFSIKVKDGQGLGLFAVADGGELGVDLSDFEDGGLLFRNILTGGAASIEDGLAPLVTNAAKTPLPIQPLHALGNDDGSNFLNPAAGLHAVELSSEALGGENDDTILLGFEDGRVTGDDFDGDYNDIIIAVSDEPLSADVVESLLSEIGSAAAADVLIA